MQILMVMEKEILKQETLSEVFKATPHLLKFPVTKMWIDYDKEADVLYVSLERPQRATDTDILEDGTFLRLRGKKVVGLTITNVSKKF